MSELGHFRFSQTPSFLRAQTTTMLSRALSLLEGTKKSISLHIHTWCSDWVNEFLDNTQNTLYRKTRQQGRLSPVFPPDTRRGRRSAGVEQYAQTPCFLPNTTRTATSQPASHANSHVCACREGKNAAAHQRGVDKTKLSLSHSTHSLLFVGKRGGLYVLHASPPQEPLARAGSTYT